MPSAPTSTRTPTFAVLATTPTTLPAGAYRGFGVCQSEFALESLIDLLAEKVGLDPWEIRYHNAIEPGEVLPNGQIADCSTALKETLLEVKDAYYAHPGHAGIACAMKNAGVGVGLPDAGRCKIRVENGVATVYAATSDIGQGCNTVFLQDVAEAWRPAASLHRQRRVLYRERSRLRHHVWLASDGRDRRGRARCRLPAARCHGWHRGRQACADAP